MCIFIFIKGKGKCKVVPVLFFSRAPRQKGVLGNGSIAPPILDLGTRRRLVVSFTPRPIYPHGKSLWYPLNMRLGGPQSRSLYMYIYFNSRCHFYTGNSASQVCRETSC